MKQYHKNFIEKACRYIDFRDKIVLEVGSGNGEVLRAIAIKFQPKMIVGINYQLEPEQFQ